MDRDCKHHIAITASGRQRLRYLRSLEAQRLRHLGQSSSRSWLMMWMGPSTQHNPGNC